MIKRDVIQELESHLNKKEISFIVGPRQAGKTTIMRFLEDKLKEKGGKTLFLNLDIEEDNQYFKSQKLLLRKIELEIGKEGFVFIDEIQRKENAGVFLKGIYDMNLPYKFIVSGSGSVELKEKTYESLAGRKRLFGLGTLSFKEFLNYRTDYKYDENLENYTNLSGNNLLLLLKEYMIYGGYPKIVLNLENMEKRREIAEIYRSYIEKDILLLLNIRNREQVDSLIKIIASQIGRITKLSELSNTVGISLQSVKNYLWYFEKTFVLKKVNPFFTNKRKEITKAPVYYFTDTGLRNYLINMYDEKFFNPNELGYLFENFVYLLLLDINRDTNININFWRTKDKAEVDFVLNTGRKLIPVEVKYNIGKNLKIGNSLINFIKRYHPETAYLITPNKQKELLILGTEVKIIPFYRLLSENILNLMIYR
jgi:predicted AAA+ superfamily ATPase